MVGPQSSTTSNRCRLQDATRRTLSAIAACVCVLLLSVAPVSAQNVSNQNDLSSRRVQPNSTPARTLSATLPDAGLADVLERKGNLTLRDVSIIEALFVLREQWKVDMVIADDVEGQVNATFTGASLREILDSLLLSRGYGYQIVGRSIVILPLDQLSSLKPLFNPEIIRLQSADPDELIEVVDLLLSPQGKALPLTSSQSILVLDYPDRMELIRSRLLELDLAAGQMSRDAAEASGLPNPADAFAPAPDADGTIELDVRVFRPQFVKVQTLLPAIESLISRNGRVAVLENEDQVIVAERTEILDVIEEAVAALDQPRPQVRIWAMIYDCSLDDVERLGVNWRSAGFDNGRRPDGTPRNQVLLDAITAAAPAIGVPNGALSLMSLGTNVDISAVINALQQSNESRLLADPNVVVTNHEPAKISIVTEVPYQQLTQGLEGGSIGTTAFREAGVSLEVTPHIARDGTISLLVNPQFSVLTGFTENDEQPIIDRREAKTTVRVTNGETFVLGGLRQRTRINNRSGIPYLKDVKYLGKLFRYKQESFRDSELLVFITPEIVSVVADPRPRELAADRYGREELNRNRRAPDVCWTHAEWDSQSFGGPWRTMESPPGFGFTSPTDHNSAGSNTNQSPTPQSNRSTAEAEASSLRLPPTSVVPAIPYEDPASEAVDQSAAGVSAMRPMSQRLQGSIRAIDQGSGPALPNGAGGPPGQTRPPANGQPAGLPGVNLDALINLLPMNGQNNSAPRSTPTRAESSRVELLRFDARQRPRPPQVNQRTEETPQFAEETPPFADGPVTTTGPGSSIRN
jgi:general secretion pathway protein D